jgi:hypothetical protein
MAIIMGTLRTRRLNTGNPFGSANALDVVRVTCMQAGGKTGPFNVL